MGKFYSEKIVKLNQIKTQLININNLPHYKPSEQIRCNFTGSIMETPFLGWKSNRRVSYAIQYRKKGFYSQVSDWSIPYTLSNKAFPNLDIGIAPEGTTRFIFRKFDSDRPELVGIVEDRNKIEFKDMHRDFYNLFL